MKLPILYRLWNIPLFLLGVILMAFIIGGMINFGDNLEFFLSFVGSLFFIIILIVAVFSIVLSIDTLIFKARFIKFAPAFSGICFLASLIQFFVLLFIERNRMAEPFVLVVNIYFLLYFFYAMKIKRLTIGRTT